MSVSYGLWYYNSIGMFSKEAFLGLANRLQSSSNLISALEGAHFGKNLHQSDVISIKIDFFKLILSTNQTLKKASTHATNI